MWTNYHTHTHYCDGKGTVTDFVNSARSKGVAQLGFSSHAPLPFPCKWSMDPKAFGAYLEEINLARRANRDVEIFSGLEIDYIPGIISPADFSSNLDYTIGSIHFVGTFEGLHWEVDNTNAVFDEGLQKVFKNDISAAIATYFRLTRQMLKDSPPDILGHMDKIKINGIGRYFSEDEQWYRNEVEKTVRAIAEANTIVEVNTRGLYKKKSDTTYPSPWILDLILKEQIPVTISSDAHHIDELTKDFSSTRTLLRDIGFKNIHILTNGMWRPVPIDDYGSTP